jgi:hypothetical protein
LKSADFDSGCNRNRRVINIEGLMYYCVEPYYSLLQRLELLLEQPEFFACVTGSKASGKSALIETAATRFEECGAKVLQFPRAAASHIELRTRLLEQLGIEGNQNFTKKLQAKLEVIAQHYNAIVLIFDDCGQMDDASLLELTKLTDIHVSRQCSLSIIISGDDELRDRINSNPDLSPVLQRISEQLPLPDLDVRTLPAFVTHHAIHKGRPDTICDHAAVRFLADVSNGKPGAVLEIWNAVIEEQIRRHKTGPAGRKVINQVLGSPALGYTDLSRNRQHHRAIAVTGLAIAMIVALAGGLSLRGQSASPLDTGPSTVINATELTRTADSAHPDTAPALPLTEALVATRLAAEPIASQPVAAEPNNIERVTLALQRWADAWQSQDLETYFASYDSFFMPSGFNSRAAWQQSRQQNISNRRSISLRIGELTILSESDDRVVVSFWLEYRSPEYGDLTLKQMEMVQDPLSPGSWRIRRELNLEVNVVRPIN